MTNERQRTISRMYAVCAVALLLVTILAITFAVQEHNKRILTDEIAETASELPATGSRIASVRDVQMKDMNDYVRAYSQMEPLLDEYDRDLQRYADLYSEARKKDRSFFNTERFYRKLLVANWENISEILDITRALSKVISRETSIIQNMALLPEPERM